MYHSSGPPPCLFILYQGHLQKKLVKQSVSFRSFSGILYLEERDRAPLSKENGGSDRLSGGHETEIDDCSTLQQISTGQDTPGAGDTKAIREPTELEDVGVK